MITYDEHEILRKFTNIVSFDLYTEIMQFLDSIVYKNYENEISKFLDNESTLRTNIGLMIEEVLKKEIIEVAFKFTIVFSEEASLEQMFRIVKSISILPTLDTQLLKYINDIISSESDLDNIEKLADILELSFDFRQQDIFDNVLEIDNVVFDVIENTILEKNLIDIETKDIYKDITRSRLINFLTKNVFNIKNSSIYNLLKTIDIDYEINKIAKVFRNDIGSTEINISISTCIAILVFFSNHPQDDVYKYLVDYINKDLGNDVINKVIIFIKEHEEEINSIRGIQ